MPVSDGVYYFEHRPEAARSTPVVLVHGAGGNHLSWPPGIRRLPEHHVYAPDLRGHGKSDGHGEQTLRAYADHLAAWMDRIGVFRAFLVGHSMGGGIVLEMALHHPHHAAGIVVMSAGSRLPVSEDLLERLSIESTFPAALDMLQELSFGEQAPPKMVDQAMKRFAEGRHSVLRTDFQACNAFDVTAELGNIHCPALVICGARDRMTPLRYSQLLANQMDRAILRVLPEAGHMVALEQPDEVGKILLEFLKDKGRSG